MRIGHGYDVHRLVAERKLILGGVTIPHSNGLLGHSDADVLLHAICDAVIGALGKGDIGQHFPDTDAAFAGVNSRELLVQVVQMMLQDGYQVGNIDATVVAQAPKLMAHLPRMRANIADDCGCAPEQINIKATTTETLGFVGREEGIAAHAVVLLEKNDR